MSLFKTVTAIWLFLPGYFLFANFKCSSAMDNDFCKALVANDRQEMKKYADEFLRSLDTKAGQKANFENIKAWITHYDCVANVNESLDLLDSDPPIKEFIIHLKAGGSNTIGIRLSPNRWNLNVK